jgi:serine/threonine-protein kinase
MACVLHVTCVESQVAPDCASFQAPSARGGPDAEADCVMSTGLRSDLWDHLQALLGEGFHLERELDAGGMSQLFLATDRSLDRPVVVKVLPPEMAGGAGEARFQREIELTAHFQHPHLLPTLAAGADEWLRYYVMPFVEGESLQKRLEQRGVLEVAEASRLLGEVADALAYAHARGVVHRDVKPANILLSGEHAILVDFGVADATRWVRTTPDIRITYTGHYVGTTAYMAPEQFDFERDADGRADVYALGVVVYEALAGRLPFPGETPNQMLAARATTIPTPLAAIRPDVPRALSDLVTKALAFTPEARLKTAAELRDGLQAAVQRPAVRRRRGRIAGVAMLLAAAGAGVVLWQATPDPDVNHDRVAIAPFDVLSPEHILWREGFVDVLSANLDGAGPLRTVPPSVVMRRWSGRPDAESAIAFGRRTGARFIVLGRVIGGGPDTVRVAAWLVDVVSGDRTEPMEVRDGTDRMDRIADSLTLMLLRDIGAVRPISAVRRASIGATSLPALRAFLEGEQHFRRTAWDSARAAYSRAIALDSTFALAHAHMGLTYAWQRLGLDSAARVHALRAGALNRGLAPRESLLIVADSLRSVVYGYAGDPEYRRHVQRLFATLQEATERYEQDAEAWYRLADAYFHFAIGPRLSVSDEATLGTFDRALSLDSAFAPAYIHPVELAFGIGDTARALRYARSYFAVRPTDVSASGTLLAARLLAGNARDTARAAATLDTASADLLFQAYSAARRSLDRSHTAIRILRLMGGRRADYAPLGTVAFANHRLALQLSFRGRIREALELPESRSSVAFAEMALAGAIPRDEAAPVFAEWLQSNPRERGTGVPLVAAAGAWWAQQGDTASLRTMTRFAQHGNPARHTPAEGAALAYTAAIGRAYIALARGDTALALRRFTVVPVLLCQLCAVPRLMHARLLSAKGRYREAAVILVDRPTLLPSAVDILWALERGRVAERLGDTATARAAFGRVERAWGGGDAELSAPVDEARAALRRLAR